MRIVDVCAFYTSSGGGVRTYIDAKLKASSRLGHEMIVIAPGERESVVCRGPGAYIATIPAPLLPVDRRYRYFHDEQALHRALDVWRPDHLEASSPWSSAAMAGRWQGAATRSLVMHCDPLAAYAYRWFGGFATTNAIDRLFSWFWRHLRRLDAMFDLVVCANRQLARRLDCGGIGKAETVAMGVEAGVFSPSLRSPELRASALQSLGLGHDATLLIGIGRLSSEKRWDMVIRAVEEIASTRPVGLLLVGEGSRHNRLKRMAEKSGSAVVLPALTDRSELARLLASADALVHGCEAETFCMVAAEARASGIPLIVPDRGAAVDQVVGEAGGIYRAGNQRALQRAIGDFIDGGAEQQRMRAMRHSDVRTIEEHFGQLFARYSQLRSERRAEPSHARSIRLVADCHTRQLGGRDCATAPIT
ncbi:MAG TPA: glycosyltransferase [Sphingomicrobium sp.]|nr:glycosyltransferase [Sphingomicrobium sp.]